MKQYSLFMRVARTLISWTASNILVAWSITMVDHVKKSYGGLAWPMVLWTCSAWASAVIGACADGQRFKFSNHWWSLSYCIVVRHGHWTPIWRGKLMSLVINAFAVSWGIVAMTVSNPLLLHESESSSIASIISQRQLRFYGHVTRYPEDEPVSWIISERDNPEWRRPRPAHKVHSWGKSMLPAES